MSRPIYRSLLRRWLTARPGVAFQNFLMDQVVFTLQPPSTPGRPVVDIPLNLIFQCFPLTTVLRLVVAVLVQAKIIFVASSYALLTVITEVWLDSLVQRHITLTHCVF